MKPTFNWAEKGAAHKLFCSKCDDVHIEIYPKLEGYEIEFWFYCIYDTGVHGQYTQKDFPSNQELDDLRHIMEDTYVD